MDIADRIRDYERAGYPVIEALTFSGRCSQTLSRSCAFVCVDRKTYWLKSDAQQGLVAELIAGRLANATHAGPSSKVIRLTDEALPQTPDCSHLVGVVFGSEDMPNAENARDIEVVIAGGALDPSLIDALARSRVVAFQTWIGVHDAQVLVRATDGQVFSFDHGDAFGDTENRADPQVIVTPIPGVAESVGRRPGDVTVAVAAIESIGDDQIIHAVSGIPHGEPWRSPVSRRAAIVEYLIHRRGRLREVMTQWAQT
jgi:hypothetical protein